MSVRQVSIPLTSEELAKYIIEFLRTRNLGELEEAFDDMTVGNYRRLENELSLILEHGGKPPNWTE